MPLITLANWAHLASPARDNLLTRVGQITRGNFTFDRIERCALGPARHDIAFFACEGAPFAWVPGAANASLGWDATHLPLSGAELARWQDEFAAFEGGVEGFDDMLRTWLRPSHVAQIEAMLVEVTPQRLDGVCDPYDVNPVGFRALVSVDGFRLPTADEWQWCCRGGTNTLFRWGDEWPDGKPYARETNFTLHRARNAFGLQMLDDPYQVEATHDMTGFVGGDGGTALCGGRPSIETWLPFASAYLFPMRLAEDCLGEFFASTWVRRVWPIE
jgi:hypothetical protein